jgi:transcription termination/antitermination protein NusG
LAVSGARWFALWTHSHCEQVVRDQLTSKGFDAFLPTIRDWSRRAGVRRLISRPMFPGYLFVHHSMDKLGYIEIMKSNGVVRILGERWDRLAPIPDAEVDAIRQVVTSELSLLPHPFLRQGQRVRIVDGPLSGIEGIFVRSRPNRGLFVLSVELLHRSVAVEVDCSAVVPIESSSTPARQLSHASTASATVFV